MAGAPPQKSPTAERAAAGTRAPSSLRGGALRPLRVVEGRTRGTARLDAPDRTSP